MAHDHGDHVGVLGARLGIDPGLDQPRPDGVDAHAVLAEFGRQRPREAEHAVLGGRVGRRVRPAHMHERLDRADIDDPPLGRADLVEEGMRDVEHVEVDRQDVVPVLGHGCGVAGDRIAPVDAGIVDQDRYVAALGDLGGGGPAGLRSVTSSFTADALPPAFVTRPTVGAVEVGIEDDDAARLPIGWQMPCPMPDPPVTAAMCP